MKRFEIQSRLDVRYTAVCRDEHERPPSEWSISWNDPRTSTRLSATRNSQSQQEVTQRTDDGIMELRLLTTVDRRGTYLFKKNSIVAPVHLLLQNELTSFGNVIRKSYMSIAE